MKFFITLLKDGEESMILGFLKGQIIYISR